MTAHRKVVSPFLKEAFQSIRDVLARPLQSQHGVVEREALKHGDCVCDAAPDLEGKPARPAGGEERQHGRVAHAESRYLYERATRQSGDPNVSKFGKMMLVVGLSGRGFCSFNASHALRKDDASL